MTLLGVDIGTTHIKAGLFRQDGSTVKLASRPTVAHKTETGCFYDPEELWQTAAAVIQEVLTAADRSGVAAIGIASMAETGLLLDRATGSVRYPFIPWFDNRSLNELEIIQKMDSAAGRFAKTGLHPSFKQGLSKLLWLKKQDAISLSGAVWLSASDYIAYRLTGKMATDYTLAARTYAFRIDRKEWDTDWVKAFGLDPELFPAAVPSGTPLGYATAQAAGELGALEGTPVSVAGHDHVCAALAVGAIEPGLVFDSMGTAETLVGTLGAWQPGEKEFRSGLSYGCHVVPDRYFWMGGISASGGSVEWMRTQGFAEPLSYAEINEMLKQARMGPTGILYYPYLSGSGAPQPDPGVKGAFVGLVSAHDRSDLLKAVLEGTSYEMESIRRAAEQATGQTIRKMAAVGGGTRNSCWMQIKADVTGCGIAVSHLPEATLLGAALSAGIGARVFRDADEAISTLDRTETETYCPNLAMHEKYQHLYKNSYLFLQEPLRKLYKTETENR